MDESLLIKEETNTSDFETNPNNIKQEVPFEFVGIKSEVQVIFKKFCMQFFVMSLYTCALPCMHILMFEKIDT
jgi:hypothetical protein